MKSSFAKGIARNIRIIAESTAHIVAIDALAREMGHSSQFMMEGRVDNVRAVEKAEKAIAAFLMEPGSAPDFKDR